MSFLSSCRVSKHRTIDADNVPMRLVSVFIPVTISAPFLTTTSVYLLALSFFHPQSIRRSASSLISIASFRQRAKMLESNYLGPLEMQSLSPSGGSLGWQHAPVGQRTFDTLLSWLGLQLVLDEQWMQREFPNVQVTVLQSVMETAEKDVSQVLKSAVTAMATRTVKEEEVVDDDSTSVANEIPSALPTIASKMSTISEDESAEEEAAVGLKPNIIDLRSARSSSIGRDLPLPSPLQLPHESLSSDEDGNGVEDDEINQERQAVENLANEIAELKNFIPVKSAKRTPLPETGKKKIIRKQRPKKKRLVFD